MTTITCDICGRTIEGNPIRVEVRDGEHGHNGSTMEKTIDCCVSCIQRWPRDYRLESKIEFDDLRQILKH